MNHIDLPAKEKYPDPHHDTYSKTVFGFWVFLVTDFMLFATLFAAYAVLLKGTFGGPSIKEITHLPWVLFETVVMLFASFFAGIAGACAHRENRSATILFFVITFIIGAIFFGMVFSDLYALTAAGNSWQRSGFLSIYFTVIGTLLAHLLFGLMWIIVFIIPLFYEEIDSVCLQRLTCLKMFWQFMNVVWIFIFSIIYLIGVVI